MRVKLKRVLNVGGNSKNIPLPSLYKGFEHTLLDIDPVGKPDIVCDARNLKSLEQNQFDAIYCSHNLEHYYKHEVSRVLEGFLHVVKNGGFIQIRVPDISAVMRIVVEKNLDLEDVLYHSKIGPIMVLDVFYGYGVQIEKSREDFFAHKTGFTKKSLQRALNASGFNQVNIHTGKLELNAIAFKGKPNGLSQAIFRKSLVS